MKHKTDKKVPFARVAMWYLIGDILVKGLSVITTPVFSRILTKQEYGDFSNFTSWESILLILVTLDLGTSITRAKYDYGDKINEYISSITAVSTVTTVILYAIIELNSSFFTDLFSMDMFYIRVLFVYFLFQPAYSYMQTKHRMYMKYQFFLLFSVSSALLRTCVSLLLVWFADDKLKGRIMGYIIPVIVLYFIIYCYVWAKGRTVKWEYCKHALRISLPLIPHNLSGNLLSSSDRVMIRRFCGSEDTATYTISYTVASLTYLVSHSINRAWAPWMYDAIAEERYGEIKNKSQLYVNIFLLLIIAIMLLAPEVVLILGGEQYYEARFIIPPVMGGLVCQYIYTFYVNVEIYNKKTFSVSVGTMLSAAINLALNFIFIPLFGYTAAAYTTLAGYLVLLLFHFIIVKYRLKQAFLFDNRIFFIKIVIFILLQFVCMGLYYHNIIRYAVVCAYCAVLLYVVWKNRSMVKSIFKTPGQ